MAASKYPTYLGFRNLSIKSYLPMTMASFLKAKHQVDVFCAEFFITRVSALISAINVIVFGRSKPQMSRITASWVIARMANKTSFWNRTFGYFIGDSMRSTINVFARTRDFSRNLSVTIFIFGANKLPAIRATRSIDLTPQYLCPSLNFTHSSLYNAIAMGVK